MTTEQLFWQALTPYLNKIDFSYLGKESKTMNPNTPTITLPDLITNIRRIRGGYFVYNGQQWEYYLERDLSPEQVEELEDWLLELTPDRKRAA